MISIDRITDKFRQLDDYLQTLDEMRTTSEDKFLADKVLIGASKYYLQVSIECCLDIANHIISAEGFRPPKDYADSFRVLEEQQIVEEELGRKLMQMAKFRNRLVHLYGEVDDQHVHQFMNEDLGDISAFKQIVVDRFLRDNT
jgi:uncharacterized protein YutE (UPF0331/DUF86 family)